MDQMPRNCEEVNGYWVCREGEYFHLYDPAQMCWFGFDFKDADAAKRVCRALAGNNVKGEPQGAFAPEMPADLDAIVHAEKGRW